jgi:hypothetical protein
MLRHLCKRQYYQFTCVCLQVQQGVSVPIILVFFLRGVKPISAHAGTAEFPRGIGDVLFAFNELLMEINLTFVRE